MRSPRSRYLTTIIVFVSASVVLLAVIALRSPDRISYELPQLDRVASSAITSVTIERPRGTITLERTPDGWLVGPGGYEADAAIISSMIATLTNLSITDVVSVSDDPSRFDLDEASKVRVAAYVGEQVAREIEIGRRAATFDHTFVSIPGDERILQAGGSLRGVFDREVDELRDKSVLSFQQSLVTQIAVERSGDSSARIVVERAGNEWQVAQAQGSEPALEQIDRALRFLSGLSAYRFRYDAPPAGEPWLRITISADQEYRLELYPQDGSVYPARSSGSDEPFDMLLFQASLLTEPFGLSPPAR